MTINDFIQDQLSNEEFLIDNTIVYSIKNDISLPNGSVLFRKYKSLIDSNLIEVEIDDKLMTKFKYNPKLVSKKLYGTTSLWYLILWVNKMVSPQEFTKKKIKVFNPNKIDVLRNILSEEEEYLELNKYETGV